MNNVLKIVLLIIGIGLIGYGLFAVLTPEFSINAGPIRVEAHEDNSQNYAMIGFGVLALISGLAFRRR